MRIQIAAITLSAAAFVGILTHEGYSSVSYTPVAGDVPTIGFGTTENVKPGDKTDPINAVNRALKDISKMESAIKKCVTVPLHQWEYNAYASLTYNIGASRFCKSTLVALLNKGEYIKACEQILKWDHFKGRKLAGLTKRRQAEYQVCIKDPHV